MRISIKYKIFIPCLVSALVFGGFGYWYMSNRLHELQEQFLSEIATDKADQIRSSIAMLATQAVEKAALFATIPEVVSAFRQAHNGDIDDENDLRGHEARALLRKKIRPFMESFQTVTGEKLKLHFHLPNGHSLVRLWRNKQTKRGGEWIDISDDISAFRETVLEVNRTGKVVKGIELGRGGFVIRGVAPVKGADGTQLGSVEVLLPFNPLLAALANNDKQDVALYMDTAFLTITTALRNATKYPVLNDKFVSVVGAGDPGLAGLAGTSFLERALGGKIIEIMGTVGLIGFPIHDYKGKTIGCIVYATDISGPLRMIARQGVIFILVLALILVASIGTGSLIFVYSVQYPTRTIIEKIKDIAEDKADLNDTLHLSSNDEIGDLSHWFNTLMKKIASILCDTRMYMNIMNSLPDPIFAVDEDFKIITANQGLAKTAGILPENLPGMKCNDVMHTKVCGTDECPIAQVKKRNERIQCDMLELNFKGERRVVRPYGDTLFDCDGNKIGYYEVAQDVTALHENEQRISRNLEQIERVNGKVNQAAVRLADLSNMVAERIDSARDGSEQQSRRVMETASAMEQMNSSIMNIADSAMGAAGEAEQARDQAQEGASVVLEAQNSITSVHELTKELRSSMSGLNAQTEDIGRIITVINDVADQTNLLALNAAIEAARAGDAGRGFAVVADEVRKLAEKTMVSTKEVGDAISAIQNGARSSMHRMEDAAKAVDEATELASRSGQALERIVRLVESTSGKVRGIAQASEEQSTASEQVTTAMDEINQVTHETSQGMIEASKAINELVDLSMDLRKLSES